MSELDRKTLAKVVEWISKRDAMFAHEIAQLRQANRKCWLYPACKVRGGCAEHDQREPLTDDTGCDV